MALSNDDLFLVNDSQDGGKAKKIKYSTLKSDIETDVGASDLQAVTDAGNTTTNGATFGAGNINLQANGIVVSKGLNTDGSVSIDRLVSGSDAITVTHGGDPFKFRVKSDGNTQIGGDVDGDSPNITLSANGDANLTGNVYSGGNPNAGGANGARLLPQGQIYVSNATANANLWRGYTTGNSTWTSEINNDGSASFGSGNITLNADGSASFGGNTTRNTRELWESLLTDEQKEQLEAGTLAIPANVSTPGDGSFARQWWYDQQSAEDQALIDSGELSYPNHLQPANFTDVFALTNIDLNSNGSASFSGNVTTPEVVLDKTNNYGAYGRVYLNSGGANDFGVQLKHHSNSTVYDAGVFLGGTSVNQAGRIRFYTSRNPGTDDAIHSACIESNGSFTIGGDSSGWNPSIALTASGAGNFNGVITTKKVVKRDTVATIANSTSFSLLDSNFWVTAANASTILNPTDIQTAMSGVIYCTAEVTAWGDKWKWPGGAAPVVPANSVVPYYVKATDEIIAGLPTKEYA